MQNEKAIKHYQEGMAHYRNGKLANAERACKKAIKINPRYADAHNDLGNVYLKMGRLKESFNAYRKALNLAPDHPMLLNNLGNVLMAQGEYEKALNWLNKSVELDPDNAATHCNLGNTFRSLGESRKAVAAYRHAIELNPRQGSYCLNLGGVLIELEEFDEAVECFNQVLQLNPEDQKAYLGLGKARNAQGNLDQAVASYQKAISIDPANAKCYRGLGGAYGDHGETDKAISALQKALEIDPKSIPAYQELTRNKKFIEADADVKAMESLFSMKEITDTKKGYLAFSLGKAYEDLGEFDKSMEFVTRAARLKRNSFDYSIANSSKEFDRIKQVFSADFFSEYADVGDPDRTPIFVLGMPRSGTSLVEQILASHPAVFGAGELNNITTVYRSLEKSIDSPKSSTFPEALIGLGPDELANLGKQYVASIRKYSAQATFIVDKMPHNFLHIGFIRAILPNARIIHCTRDPLDNCLSLFKTEFQKGHLYSYDLCELGQYYKLYRELMDYWKTTLPGFIQELNYEDLVSHQEEQTKRLLQYCELPWDDACMNFHRTRRKIKTASNAQVVRPIYQDSVKLWTRYESYLEPLISTLNG
ncbi:MAG: tetratricopeptide repeat protein [Gammaproteobacteria bacterium]|nr:tetratricopeptide repeat protein [Gammaproteobacteria bacterium]